VVSMSRRLVIENVSSYRPAKTVARTIARRPAFVNAPAVRLSSECKMQKVICKKLWTTTCWIFHFSFFIRRSRSSSSAARTCGSSAGG
jgi:hypothetical protein